MVLFSGLIFFLHFILFFKSNFVNEQKKQKRRAQDKEPLRQAANKCDCRAD